MMDKVKLYHVGDNGLQEGEALGRISVVLKADYEIEVKRLRTACEKEFESVQMLDNELTKARELIKKVKSHVSRLCKVAGSQPSIATGYMRDVLELFDET